MPVDEIREAVERSVPAYDDRPSDWNSIVAAAATTSAPSRRLRWLAPAAGACLAVAALLLFWPGGGQSDSILDRALAAVGDGPVIHMVLQARTVEYYDLERRKSRQAPVMQEIWFDPERGTHSRASVEGRVLDDVLMPPGPGEGGLEGRLVALGEAYRKALRGGDASVGEQEKVDGRAVYWISFEIRYPDVVVSHRVAVDAETYEPRIWREEALERPIVVWETFPAGRGDFTAARTVDRTEPHTWYSSSRVGTVTPEQARGVLPVPPLWLGTEFADLPLAFIREVRYETGRSSRPLEPDERLPGLELCYGSGEPCAVTVSQAARPHDMIGRSWGLSLSPPPGSLSLAEDDRHAFLVRDGLYVAIEAEGRERLIAAGEALTPIPG
jgi:hypothetical protein